MTEKAKIVGKIELKPEPKRERPPLVATPLKVRPFEILKGMKVTK